jgi:hypothetical protein
MIWGAALVFASTACGESDEPAGAAGSGASGGASGSAGSAASGGSAGSAGAAGTSGSAGSAGAAGTSGSAGAAGSSGTAHSYTPFALSDCDDGAVGEPATGLDALADTLGPGTVYSDEQALDGAGKSCKTFAEAGQSYFGGRFRTPNMNVGDTGDLWIRQALYFPQGFCFGYGAGGDGWGATKWIRVEFDDGNPSTGGPGSRLTLELGNFASNACNSATEIWGAAREYAGTTNCQPASFPALETGAWRMVQWHTHFAADGSGFIRFWLDDEFLGQWDGQTLPSSLPKIDFVQYGDYWNGTPFQDVEWYMDDVIMSSETPDTLDAGGRPYISPQTRVSDWD